MLIHEENIFYNDRTECWEYYIPNVGFDNDAWITFHVPYNQIPRTGDRIINNRLVKETP